MPRLDRDAQWPEGVAPVREFTMGMEYAAGASYRALRGLLGGVPFHVYLAAFVSFWSSLSIGAAFLGGRALWGTPSAGLVSAIAAAVTPAALARTPGNFLREDFALPFLFASFALSVVALRGGGAGPRGGALAPASASLPVPALLAAVALAAGVSTWHLARFYVLVLFLALAGVVAGTAGGAGAAPPRGGSVRGRDAADGARALLLALVGGLTLAGLLVPVLREKRFLLSPGYLVGLASLAWLEFARRRAGGAAPLAPRAFAAGLVAACAAGILLARALPGAEGEYAHTSALLAEKLRFLGRKPADPALLSDDARVFWVGPFGTPSVSWTLLSLSTMLLWGPVALAAAARDALRGRLDRPRLLAVVLVVVFAGSALLIERLSIFLVFFAALLLPGVPVAAPPARRRAVFALLAAAALYEVAYLRAFDRPNPWRRWVESRWAPPPAEAVPNFANNARVVAWIRRHVPERAAVLTWFPAGPMVLTDTGRPVNLHSMFESSALRAKERRVRAALYGAEEDLFALCREWESDYLLYSANLLLDTTTESYRYMAGRLRVPSTSAAVLLHFFPERLRRFEPVYQDSYYRLFRVVKDGAAAGAPAASLPYEEMFDPAALVTGAGGAAATPEALGEAYPDDRSARVLARLSARLADVERGIAAEASGRARDAEAIYRRVLAGSPDAVEAQIRLGLLLLGEGRAGEADSVVSRALAARPEYAELRYARGLVLERLGRRDEAAAAYREAIAISPSAHPARERLRALGPPG